MLTDLMKIMLVEDDPQDRDSFRVATSRIPYFAIVYETGSEQEALDFLLTHTVDVIILDIDLEEGDGVSFLDSLAEQKIDKPYIAVVTNNSSAITLGYVRDHGADYIYRKDNRMYTPEEVLDEDSAELIILKVEPEDGEDMLVTIDDDDLLDTIFNLFVERLEAEDEGGEDVDFSDDEE